jgi:hypothetical protein
MLTVFRDQLVSKDQSLRGNVFANSYPRNGHMYNIIFQITRRSPKWSLFFRLSDTNFVWVYKIHAILE